MREQTDIVIAGGGIAGMSAAVAFAQAGFAVVLVDPAPAGAGAADLRSTALLQPAQALLARIGLWPLLETEAMPLALMRIIDAGRGPERARAEFESAEIGEAPFGWNLPNRAIRAALMARMAALPGLQFRPATGYLSHLARDEEVIVRLSGGASLTARLLIGADGRNSAVRVAAGIAATTHRYGQKAVVFTATHPIPHGNVSTEVHRAGGPFTLVPLPEQSGSPASAVVWMEQADAALRLAALDKAEFEAAASDRSALVYGPLKLASKRQTWPIISRRAARMTDKRLALMAEAAHVVPPIGAQGLNMSLADLACLINLAEAAPASLGSAQMLAAYGRAREPDVRLRVLGIDALNRASMAGAPLLKDLRALGLRALHGPAPLRRSLMKLGLGAGR